MADRFLHHPDQRFRLSYLLGSWRKNMPAEPAADEWDFGEVNQAATAAASSDEAVSSADAEALQARLVDYVGRITGLAASKAEAISKELLPDPHSASAEDREAASEIFQSELFADERLHEIVHDVIDEALLRFEALESGELTYRSPSSKWPLLWTCSTDDRTEFLKQVRWFSSNFAPSFGKLLTPLVDGIRIMGPLFPTFTGHQAKVVLLDGQGLGHTPDSSTSVTTHITRRFSEVDVILLVDNAEQPVQAAAQSVLRAVASSGNYNKLLLAFTHFDQVKGLNLPTFADKRAHVLASVHNYLSKLKEVLNAPIVAAMERTIDDQSFMLGALEGPSTKSPPGVQAQLNKLITLVEESIEPPPVPDAKPHYDGSGLGFAVQRAADSFQKAWAARLGLSIGATLPAEHWTRIKALNRKISNETGVEYDSLRPVADLLGRIIEEVTNFLDNPISWSRPPVDADEAQQAIAPIRQVVFSRLHQLALQRLIDEHLPDWRRGLEHKGKGSAARRAVDIRGIYELAAPIPGTVNTAADPLIHFTHQNLLTEPQRRPLQFRPRALLASAHGNRRVGIEGEATLGSRAEAACLLRAVQGEPPWPQRHRPSCRPASSRTSAFAPRKKGPDYRQCLPAALRRPSPHRRGCGRGRELGSQHRDALYALSPGFRAKRSEVPDPQRHGGPSLAYYNTEATWLDSWRPRGGPRT